MSKYIKRINGMDKQECFKLRDAIRIISMYLDIAVLKEIQEEVTEKLNQMAENE